MLTLFSPRFSLSRAVLLLTATCITCRPTPNNIMSLYSTIRSQGSCKHVLAGGFYATDDGTNSFSYCADHLDTSNVIFIQGRHGELADMDVDCDGIQGGPADDGRCSYGRSPDLQNTTAFQDVVESYNVGIKDLDPYVIPYVVFGNTGTTNATKAKAAGGWPSFDPTSCGIEPLSIVAVVCGDQLVYGIWGDTNGDDGDKPMVGEASLALATACEGPSMTGNNGYDGTNILYVAFRGHDAVPGPKGRIGMPPTLTTSRPA
ncbi:fungal chitosanase of glycosyl hydrolase group 75-domain-containing protein [Bombardia bombarda]|uniref:Endo-chitosanase n=1 Tax=Bombardia bombarda TaxID=252184 RepID=A0AA39XBC4_9PEZI|nr:fungal chitosanase of glycosyl hydrolase group 75-domain-containing protein [Bombardia bombarda]